MPEISVDIESKRPVIAANLEELRYLVFYGMTGDDGKSAYELAVELGFEGTEQEWLDSLQGADGKNYGIVVDGSTDNVLELKAVEATGGVTSVNGKTGAVALKAADLQTLPLYFNDAETIPNDSDFNSYLAPGSYKVTSYAVAKTVSNIPEKISGRLIVLNTTAAARAMQLYIPAAQTVKLYARTYYDSWSGWARLQTTDEIQLALASAGASALNSNSDFNTYKTPGNYFVSSGTAAGNIANCPASVAGRLTVMETHGAERVKQTYELSREDGATYTRYFNGTSWGNWNLEKGESVLGYWDSAITTAADAINNQRAVTINGTDYTINSGLSGDRFVFVTDTHWTWGAKHTPQIINSLLQEVGKMKIFHGGDIVDSALSGVGESATDAEKQERQNYYKRLLCETKAALDAGSPMFYCIGNHEYFNPDQAAAFLDWQLTPDEVYRAVVAGNGAEIIDHDALGDYCFDNAANKIRYFFIACDAAYQIAEGSATWLASALDEMPAGYTAIIISHVALNTVINEDSTSAHYGEVVPLSTFSKIITVLETAKNNGVDIGFVISGHTHVDRYCYTGGGILIVTTATDAYRKTKEGGAEDGSTREGYNTMTPGTATEHCFDVVSFDTANRVVALTRIGAGVSRAFTF